MTSAGDAAASAATVGQRSSQACQRGTTRSTWVCCAITSETRIAYASRVSRHGRARAFWPYHSRSAASTRLRLRAKRELRQDRNAINSVLDIVTTWGGGPRGGE